MQRMPLLIFNLWHKKVLKKKKKRGYKTIHNFTNRIEDKTLIIIIIIIKNEKV